LRKVAGTFNNESLDGPMTCRIFVFDANGVWVDGFMEELCATDWKTQFALSLNEFKDCFVESETDVLILRGTYDLETLEYIKSVFGEKPSCGLIWIYPRCDRLNSPYFLMADNSVPYETSYQELIAITRSIYSMLTPTEN